MSNLAFGIHIILLTVAISAAYAILMSILKKEHNALWLKGETLTSLISAGVALSFSVQYLTGNDMLFMLSSLLLILGLINALGLAAVQRMKIKEAHYPEEIVSVTRTLAIVMFITFVASFLIELAALARI